MQRELETLNDTDKKGFIEVLVNVIQKLAASTNKSPIVRSNLIENELKIECNHEQPLTEARVEIIE